MLILNNHRLIYLKETPYAPSLNSFQATIKKFINLKRDEYISLLYAQRQEKITKKSLSNEFPKATLDIVPLGGKSSIKDFIQRFDLLQTVTIKLLETNNELDNNEFFRMLRKQQELTNSDKTKLEFGSKHGLDKEYMEDQLAIAIGQGNANVNLEGKDNQGNVIKGNNDSFKINIFIDAISNNLREVSNQLFNRFQNLRNRNQIDLGEIQDREKLIEKLRDSNILHMNNE